MRVSSALSCVIAVAVATSCSGDGTVSQSTNEPPRGPTTHAQTSTTTAPFSFDDSSRAPEIINTGTDQAAIALSLLEAVSWLNSHRPNEALLADVIAPGTNLEKAAREQLANLRRTNGRFYEVQDGASTVDVVAIDSDIASLQYTQRLRKQVVVAPDGEIKSRREFTTPTTSYTVVIVKQPSGRWVLLSIDSAEPGAN